MNPNASLLVLDLLLYRIPCAIGHESSEGSCGLLRRHWRYTSILRVGIRIFCCRLAMVIRPTTGARTEVLKSAGPCRIGRRPCSEEGIFVVIHWRACSIAVASPRVGFRKLGSVAPLIRSIHWNVVGRPGIASPAQSPVHSVAARASLWLRIADFWCIVMFVGILSGFYGTLPIALRIVKAESEVRAVAGWLSRHV